MPFLKATWIPARRISISLGNIPRSFSNETFLLLLTSRVMTQQVQAFSLDLTCDSLLTVTEIMATEVCLGDEGVWITTAHPQIALVELASLLLHCPDLRTLGISMDATSYNVVTPEVPGGGVINTGASLIANPLAVAAFFSSVILNLKNILYKVDTDSVPKQTEGRLALKWARAATYLRDEGAM